MTPGELEGLASPTSERGDEQRNVDVWRRSFVPCSSGHAVPVPETEEEGDEDLKPVDVRRRRCTLSSIRYRRLACSLLCALAAAVLVRRLTCPGMPGMRELLAEYDTRGAVVLHWRKLAGRLKGAASKYGVNADDNEAKDPVLRRMMDASGMANAMDQGSYDRVGELLSEASEAARRRAQELGLDLPAASLGRLGAAGAKHREAAEAVRRRAGREPGLDAPLPTKGRPDAAGAVKRLWRRRERKAARRLQAPVIGSEAFAGQRAGEPKAEDKISLGQCVIQSNVALGTIANAGLDLNAILQICRNDTVDGNPDFDLLTCGANVADLVGQVAALAAIVAQLPSLCGVHEDLRAICASDISLFASAVSLTVADGITVALDCPGDEAPRPVWAPNGGANQLRAGSPDRRLREAPQAARAPGRSLIAAAPPELTLEQQAENDHALASCWMFAYFVATDMPAVAMDIWTTSLDCQDVEAKKDKHHCVSDILATIADVSALLSDAAAAAADCPLYLPPRAACISGAADIAMQALTFGAWSEVIKGDCRGLAAIVPRNLSGADYGHLADERGVPLEP